MRHRFLDNFDRVLRSGGKRVWTLDGLTEDVFYFDAWYGTVNLRRSLAAWARRRGFQAFAVLSVDGRLDFSGSADPAAAERLFYASPPSRRPKYGQHFKAEDPAASAPKTEELRQAETLHSDAAGLRNLFDKITAFVTRQRPDGEKVLLLVEDITYLLGDAGGDGALRNELRHTILTQWCVRISSSAIVVFSSATAWQQEQNELFDDRNGTNRNGTFTIPPPDAAEILASLFRLSTRSDFRLFDLTEVSNWLAGQKSDLRSALDRVVSVARHCRAHCAPETAPLLRLGDFIHLPELDETALEQVWAKIDALVGLTDIKAAFRRIAGTVERNRAMLLKGLTPPDETRHMLFLGNPGTGKTEVGRLVGPLFTALGLLSGGKFIETSFSELRSEYTGETGARFRRLLEDARGGVVFFDEIHQLGEAGDAAPAREIKDVLVGALENMRRELVFIGAGYASRMAGFWRLDPGLESRFPRQYRFDFKDYRPDELLEIFKRQMAPLTMAPGVETRVRAILAARAQRPQSGNARAVRMLAESVKALLPADAAAITPETLPPLLERRESELETAHAELDNLIGLTAPRRLLQSVMDNLEYDIEFNADTDGMVRTHPGNMLFVGPPGTGKTTMAEIMAHYLYGLGVTERRDPLMVTAKDLVGEYLGQTAPRVGDVFSRAQGGVLFIDEAYALADNREFGRQAVTALVGEITMPANASVIVILAGYGKEMERVFALNEGLRRRIAHTVEFANFSGAECALLARRLVEKRRYRAGEDFFAAFEACAEAAIRRERDHFGNAGWCVNLVEQTLSNMKARVIRARKAGVEVDPRLVLTEDLEGETS